MEEMYALARCRQWYSAHCATSLAALARSAECSAQQTNDHAANKWMRVIMPYNRSAVRVLVAARAWGVLESRRILARVQAKPSTGVIFGALQASCNVATSTSRIELEHAQPPTAGGTASTVSTPCWAYFACTVSSRRAGAKRPGARPPKPAPVQVDTTLPRNRRHQPTRPILPTCCSPVQLRMLHLLSQCVSPGQP